MNKAELLAMGLPEESIREFQSLYHRDMMKAARRITETRETDDLRKAIISTLSTIEAPERLRAILAAVTHHYLKDYRDRNEKAAPSATNTQSGKAKQEVSETDCFASNHTEN